MKFKKVTALALCVAMSATALAGCGSKAATTDSQTAAPAESAAADTADTAATEEAPVETKDVTLKVWAPQEDQNPTDTYDKGMLAAMCDAFNEAHPEWNITYEYGVCGEDVAKDEVTKDVDAAADVYMFANDSRTSLIAANGISKLGGQTAEDVKKNNSQAIVDSVSVDGDIYGVPFTTNTYVPGWMLLCKLIAHGLQPLTAVACLIL